MKNNQLLSFIVLSFLISWTIWILNPLIFPNDMQAQQVVNTLGAFGPSIAAVIITLLINEKSALRRTVNIKAFLLALALIFAFALLSMEQVFHASRQPLNIILFALISVIAALIISMAFSRNPSMKSFASSLVKGRLPLKWYFFALLLFPAVSILSVVLENILNDGGTVFFLGTFSRYACLIDGKLVFFTGKLSQYAYLLVMTFIGYGLFGGSLNEEVGWRGFAMPRLLNRFNPFAASLIMGVIWTVWHGPLHFNGFYGNGLIGFLSRFPTNIALAFIFTYLFNKTKGSLLMAVLLHTAVNLAVSSILPTTAASAGYRDVFPYVLLIGLLIIDWKIWFRPFGVHKDSMSLN